jgi:AcrR family transcriptional regulator
MTLTAKGAATRDRIVAGAAAEMREHGVVETTLDDVRARTSTSKSQLFHYFPGGREDLLLAVASYEAEQVIDHQQPLLGHLTTWPAWLAWRDHIIRHYEEQGQSCPLNALTSLIGRTTPAAQEVVSAMMERWQAEIRRGVETMQAAGEIDPALVADDLAAALVAAVQGGVGMMMSTGRTRHLEAAVDLVIERLRAAAI